MKRLLLFFILTHSLTAFAMPTYIVGLENINYPPFSFVENDKITKSFFKDVLESFARDNNIKFNYRVLPIKRLSQSFTDQKIDFKIPDNESWRPNIRKGKKIIYSVPVYKTIEAVYVKKELPQITSMAIILGFNPPSNPHFFDGKKINIYTTPKLESALKMIEEERVQSIFISEDVLNSKYPKNALIRSSLFDQIETAYSLSTISHPKVIEKFNKWIKENPEKIMAIKKRFNLL